MPMNSLRNFKIRKRLTNLRLLNWRRKRDARTKTMPKKNQNWSQSKLKFKNMLLPTKRSKWKRKRRLKYKSTFRPTKTFRSQRKRKKKSQNTSQPLKRFRRTRRKKQKQRNIERSSFKSKDKKPKRRGRNYKRATPRLPRNTQSRLRPNRPSMQPKKEETKKKSAGCKLLAIRKQEKLLKRNLNLQRIKNKWICKTIKLSKLKIKRNCSNNKSRNWLGRKKI